MIIVVGSINMDLSIQTETIPKIGETVIGYNFLQTPGGKGANQAVAAQHMGSEVYMVGAVGEDTIGDDLLKNLTDYKINTNFVKRAKESSGIALIQIDSFGRNNIVVSPGSNHCITSDDIDGITPYLKIAKCVVTQCEIPLDVVEYTLKCAKNYGCVTVFNPSPVSKIIPKEVFQYVDILIPNEHELSLLTGLPTETCDQCIAASKLLLDLGSMVVICTRGANGVLVVDETGSREYEANSVRAVDTTGAGDAFLGGFVSAIDNGSNIEDAIRIGQKVAAYSIQRKGAQISYPYKEQL